MSATRDFDAERRALKTALQCKAITARQYVDKLRGLDLAERSALHRAYQSAYNALKAYQDRKAEEKNRQALRRRLSRSLRRYEELPS